MTTINLKRYYPYMTENVMLEVSDEIAAALSMGNSNARIYRIRWRFCCLYVSYSSIFIPIQHFSRLI